MSRTIIIDQPKAPGDTLVITLDFTIELAGGTIAGSAWTLPAGIADVTDSFTGTTTAIEISGGTDGSDYFLLNTVTDASGIPYTIGVALKVRQPGTLAAATATRYANVADMVQRFGERNMVELTDTGEEPTGFIDQANATRALADADATIDGYLQSRYELPLGTVPPLINVYACDIARYRLMGDRSIEEVRKRFEDAISYLRKVANGELGIGVDGSGAAPAESASRIVIDANSRVFSHDSLHDFRDPRSVGGWP